MRYSSGRPKGEMTADPTKYPQGYFKPKQCKRCSELFQPVAPSNNLCSDKCKDDQATENYLKRTYNIHLEAFEDMLDSSDATCYGCGSKGFKICKTARTLLVVDHDHNTGEVRGILCHNCNRALGLLQDDIGVMKNLIGYLEGVTTIRKEYPQVRGSAQLLTGKAEDEDIV